MATHPEPITGSRRELRKIRWQRRLELRNHIISTVEASHQDAPNAWWILWQFFKTFVLPILIQLLLGI